MKRHAIRMVLSSVGLVVAILACSGLATTPTASNIRMTTDDGGETPTSSYSPGEDFYVFADVDGLPVGAQIQAKWYAVDAQDVEPDSEIGASDYSFEAGISSIYFQLSTADGGDWPPGAYRVELFLDGTKVGEQGFTVQ